MKTVINNLKKQLDKLNVIIEKREDKVLNASERWQESDKCEEFEDKTQEIEMQRDELENVIDGLEELI